MISRRHQHRLTGPAPAVGNALQKQLPIEGKTLGTAQPRLKCFALTRVLRSKPRALPGPRCLRSAPAPLGQGLPQGELVIALHRDQQVPEPSRPALATPPAPNSLFLLLIFTPSYPFNCSGASPQQLFQLTLLPARPPELSGDQPRLPGGTRCLRQKAAAGSSCGPAGRSPRRCCGRSKCRGG